ncbi:MAG: GSU2403 family nucleotidyltransferase fold protein [bacterium]
MGKLPLTTQTLYAELVEQLVALEARRSIGSLPGCFTFKTVKGESYVYFQYSDMHGSPKQVYIGRKTPALDKVIDRFQEERERNREDIENIQLLCAQLRAGGILLTDTSSARVLKVLADSGVFRLSGVLIGTYAFTVLGNVLGVRWKGAAIKTHDIDIAGGKRMEIALPEIHADIPQSLESLNMGFLPVPPLDPRHPSTSFKVRGNPLRVDILTPSRTHMTHKPVTISRFRTAAQPLRFLDFLIERPVQAAIVDGGGVLVNIPSPSRFALHKLLVAKERDVSMHHKTEKDIIQAVQVLDVLMDERPGDLPLACQGLKKRGTVWINKLRAGLSELKGRNPDVYDHLERLLE